MNNFYNDYIKKMNKVGKITGYLGAAASFLPAIVLAIVYGLLPNVGALITVAVSVISSFGVLWFVEPISYYPVVGQIGTYMAFLSGNISNMRVPCASMAQVSAEVEPGTQEGSVIATLGMAVSVIINIAVLTVGVIAGSSVLAMLPASVTEALNYLLPALFGALLMQFGIKQKKHALLILTLGILIWFGLNSGVFAWLPGASNYLATIVCIFVSIAIVLMKQKKAAK